MSPRPKRAPPVLAKASIKRGKAPAQPSQPAAPSNRQARRAAEAKARKHKPGASSVQRDQN